MVIQLRRLRDVVYLAKSFNVKVVVNYDDSEAVSRKLEYDELHVSIERDNPDSEWNALLIVSSLLDIWARFKSVYVDHEEKVVYVDV
jgi:hypothetical protein